MKKNYIILSVIISLFIFHLANNILYLALDTRPTSWDESWHEAISLSYYNQITGKGTGDLKNVSGYFYTRSLVYPHFFHTSSIPLYLLLGFSDDIASLTNMIYFFIIILFVYLIGQHLYNWKIGLCSAILISFYPIIFGMSRLYLIDFSLVAIASSTFYFLLKTKQEFKLKWLFGLGISTIIGILIKQSFAVFVLLPFAYVFLFKITENWNNHKSNRVKILWILFVGLVLAFFAAKYYFQLFSGERLYSILSHSASIDNLKTNIASLFYIFVRIQISFAFAVVFLLSLIKFKIIKEKLIFAMWIFVPVLFFAYTLSISLGRYLMPILPAVAIISSVGIMYLKNRKIRLAIILILACFALFQFFSISYESNHMYLHSGRLYFYDNQPNIINSAKNEDWRIDDTIEFIRNDSDKNVTSVSLNINVQKFNIYNFILYLYKNNYSDILASVEYSDDDYIITKTGENGAIDSQKYDIWIEFLEKQDEYKVIKTFMLPDKSELRVYKK